MRKIRILVGIISLFSIVNCGESENNPAAVACSSAPMHGVWENSDIGEVLTFTSNCTGASSLCGELFTYTDPVSAVGAMSKSVDRTSGEAGCPEVGSASCTYSVADDGQTMSYGCNGVTSIYDKTGSLY